MLFSFCVVCACVRYFASIVWHTNNAMSSMSFIWSRWVAVWGQGWGCGRGCWHTGDGEAGRVGFITSPLREGARRRTLWPKRSGVSGAADQENGCAIIPFMTRHPARFSPQLLPILARMVSGLAHRTGDWRLETGDWRLGHADYPFTVRHSLIAIHCSPVWPIPSPPAKAG